MPKVESKPESLKQLHELWSELPQDQRVDYFKKLPISQAQELFLKLNAEDKAAIVQRLDIAEQRVWMRILDPDDAADLIQKVLPNKRHHLINLFDHTNRNHISALLAYQEDEAGGLMNPSYVRVRPDMRVAEAIRYVHRQALTQVETMYYVYVLGPEQELLGMLSFRELFTSPPGEIVKDIMHTDLIKLGYQDRVKIRAGHRI